ncbi:hypothetical protein LUCX_174 [Xanthomonas phage vB_XciM_LucasX]|nr:hypothetical protein LUCX_174 [Xanthomonas phage vB_XciM_LucasX]
MSDFTKAPKQIIIDLINVANPGLNLLATEVDFGSVAVETEPANTSVVLTPTVSGRFTGSPKIYYDRLSMAEVFATKTAAVEKTDLLTNVDDVISAINSLYGINLTSDDYTISEFPTWANVVDEEHTLTITAKADSLIFIDAADVKLFKTKMDLTMAIANNQLNGLIYEPN